MILKRIATSETVQIEDGFLWADEFSWQPIQQSKQHAVDGALIIQEGEKKAGRSIVLEPADVGMGWIKLRDLRVLREWSLLQEQFELQFEQPHDNRKFTVIWNHEQGALEAEPVKGIPAISLDDYYNVTLRLTEVDNDN